MAILTYSENAPLSGFLAWVQQRGFQSLCPPSAPNTLELLSRRLTWGTRAESGDSVRMSAFLASGSATINYGGQWMDETGEYRRYNRQLVVTAASSPARITIPAAAGWYRDAAVSLETGGITGQTLYVTQELGRTNASAFAPFGMLAQGWLTSVGPVSGMTPPTPSPGGTGTGTACVCPSTFEIQAIDGVQSAQGWQVNRTPAADTVERIVQMNFTMDTGGTAGNRYMFVENVVVGAGPVFYQRTAADIPASTTMTFQVNVDEGADYNEPDVRYGHIPGSLWYSQTYQMQVGIGGFTSGDMITDAYAIIEIRT